MRRKHRNIIDSQMPRYLYESEVPEDFDSVSVPLVSSDTVYDEDGPIQQYVEQIGVVIYKRKKGWSSLWEIDYGRSAVFDK